MWSHVIVGWMVLCVVNVNAQGTSRPQGTSKPESTTNAPFSWGTGNKLHIVRMPATQEELASIIYAVTKATENQVHTIIKADMEKGRITIGRDMYITKKLQVSNREEDKLGSLEGWTPRFLVARGDSSGPFAKEKAFERVRKVARNRNTKNDAEMMVLEVYKDLRLLREDMQVIEMHQYYILMQISAMAIIIIYKLVMVFREHNKEEKHKKAIAQRKERMELIRQMQNERPGQMEID